MGFETVKDWVEQRVHGSGSYVTGGTRTVSVRLPDSQVEELDLLVGYLGYQSRQQLMADLLGAAIEDAIQTTSEALSGDPAAHRDFTEERLRILHAMDS